jgi:selenide,water dikinase
VGGHSAEGVELAVGLTVTGEPGPRTLEKGGAQLGDRVLLTKPVGTGVILAAAMQGKANPAAIEAVQASMDLSNAVAARVFNDAGAHAMTDVTGFGLIGHLGEMLRASGCGVSLNLDHVPLFPQTAELFGVVQSSLQQANELALQDFELKGVRNFAEPAMRAMADPQTSGGLLACVPENEAQDCLAELIALGYDAVDIGEVMPAQTWVIR